MIRLLSKDEVISHLLSLSPEDRYTRFCCSASDDFIRAYASREVGFFYGFVDLVLPKPADFCSVPVYSLKDIIYAPTQNVIGMIHIIHDINDRSIEVAVSVLPEHQGKGIARKLMAFATGIANAYQADKIVVHGLSSNSPMVCLAKSCGFEIHSEMGEFEGEASTIGRDMRDIIENNIKTFKLLVGV